MKSSQPVDGSSKKLTAARDLIVISVAVVVAMVVSVSFDVFEKFEVWARAYERWQVDELVVVPLVLAIAFGLYSWRRRRELTAELDVREKIEQALKKKEERFRLLAENAEDLWGAPIRPGSSVSQLLRRPDVELRPDRGGESVQSEKKLGFPR